GSPGSRRMNRNAAIVTPMNVGTSTASLRTILMTIAFGFRAGRRTMPSSANRWRAQGLLEGHTRKARRADRSGHIAFNRLGNDGQGRCRSKGDCWLFASEDDLQLLVESFTLGLIRGFRSLTQDRVVLVVAPCADIG